MHFWLALALAAADPADPLQPLRFLAGRCWAGSFGRSSAYDVMCAEEMPGGQLRLRHVVRGVAGSYRGETIYFVDPQTGAARFHYYTSLGEFSSGDLFGNADGLVRFDNVWHRRRAGGTLRLRGTGRRRQNGAYRTETEIFRDGRWQPPTVLELEPISCADWLSVEAGCDRQPNPNER